MPRSVRPIVASLLLTALATAAIVALHPSTAILGDAEPPADAWLERQKITPNDADQRGVWNNPSHWAVHFGAEVALDGDTAVVGTQMNKNSDSADEDGHDWAYVFTRNNQGRWSQVSKLVPSDAQPLDSFAYSLGLDEDAGVIVAGNPAAQKMYIFERMPNGTWVETERLESDRVFFGYDVAVSGDTIATVDSVQPGRSVLFEKGADGWHEAATIDDAVAPIDLVDDTFVGASYPNYWDMAVYHRDDQGWTRTAELPQPPASPSGDPIPNDVDLSDDQRAIVVGAPTDSRVLGVPDGRVEMSAAGSAWIYEQEDGDWERTVELPNPDPHPSEVFGDSVAIDGGRMVVGAPRDVHSGGPFSGAAYVYTDRGETWTLESKLRNSDGGTIGDGDWFGNAVDISGETILAGAPMDDNRRDGTPYPLSDESSPPLCSHPWFPECGEGGLAGSAYIFETVRASAPTGVPR